MQARQATLTWKGDEEAGDVAGGDCSRLRWRALRGIWEWEL